jgi:zinc transport system permease protein
MNNLFLEIQQMLSYGFIQRAFIVGTLLAISAPLVGQFMVVKRYSPIADSISHVALLGVAVGLILELVPISVSILSSIIGGVLVEFLRQKKVLKGEVALTVIISFSLSILSILQQKIGFRQNLESLLFGSLITVSQETILYAFIVTIISIILILAFYKSFLNISLDEDLAKVMGIKVNFLNYLLIILTASIIAVGIDIVGGLLISGLMIVPVASSLQFDLGFRKTHFLSIIFGVLSVWVGLTSAWFLDLPSGASIILISLGFFTISLISKFLTRRLA